MFDEFETSFMDPIQKREDDIVGGRLAGALWEREAASADVDGEGFFHSAWPNLHPAIGDHFEDQAIGSKGLKFGREGIDLVGPSDEDVGTDQFPFLGRSDIGRP